MLWRQQSGRSPNILIDGLLPSRMRRYLFDRMEWPVRLDKLSAPGRRSKPRYRPTPSEGTGRKPLKPVRGAPMLPRRPRDVAKIAPSVPANLKDRGDMRLPESFAWPDARFQ